MVANGSFKADEVVVYSIADKKAHKLLVSTADSLSYIFTDQEIGWKTGAENTEYELRLNPETVLPFVYESKEKHEECCAFFELVAFEITGAERLFIPQSNLFQLRI